MKFFLLPILFFANIVLAQELPNESFLFGKEYFPFNDKIELIYETTNGESKRITEIANDLYKLTFSGNNFKYSQTFTDKNNGVYLVKTEQTVKILFVFSKHAEIVYPFPALQIKQPTKVGDTWSWKGYQIKNEDDTVAIAVTGKALAEEEIEVPAGKFKTLKVQIIVKSSTGTKTTFTQWLAKNLGGIKMNIKTEGHGLFQFAMDILGYDEINSELKEIKYLE